MSRYMNAARTLQRQAGVTLIELMVGIAIGMLVVAVALTAFMTSRGLSSSVSEVAKLQQEASFIFRKIGEQLRQAGSMELDLKIPAGSGSNLSSPHTPVVFDPDNLFSRAATVVGAVPGADGSRLSVSFQNTPEMIYKSNAKNKGDTVLGSQMRNCLGEIPGGVSANAKNAIGITSSFDLNSKGELICGASAGSGQQALSSNVADFQVWYLVQGLQNGQTVIQRLSAANVTNWQKVFAVEVCLDLKGVEKVGVEGDATYTQCDGKSGSLRQGRSGSAVRHLVMRNTFQLRSQGVL